MNHLNITYDIFKAPNDGITTNLNEVIYTTVELDIINKCNLKCPMCLRQEKKESTINPKFLSIFDIKRFLDTSLQHPQMDIKLVRIVGVISEPTLHPNLADIVRLINEYGASVQISTNGNLKNDHKLMELKEELDKNKNNELLFALESVDQKTYSHYRKGGKVESVLHNIELFKDRKFYVGLQYIRFPWNKNHLNQIKSTVQKKMYDFIEILYCNQPDEMDSEYQATEDITNGFYKKRDGINKLIDRIADDNYKTDINTIKCVSVAYGELFISTTGHIYPCTNLFENKSHINPNHLSDLDPLQQIKKMQETRCVTKECYKACSIAGHKMEQKYLRERVT